MNLFYFSAYAVALIIKVHKVSDGFYSYKVLWGRELISLFTEKKLKHSYSVLKSFGVWL